MNPAASGKSITGCSTPEGIETVIRRVDLATLGIERVLNARRHRDGDQAWCGGLHTTASRCSTPEGIETVISLDARPLHLVEHVVLNARRHRDGDQLRVKL